MAQFIVVFVSSTARLEDPERQTVARAILEVGGVPVGLEPNVDDTGQDAELVHALLQRSDALVLVVPNRPADPGGSTDVERQHRWATDLRKPVVVLTQENSEPAAAPGGATPELHRVPVRIRRSWRTPDDLGGVLTRSLLHLQTMGQMPGWVRRDLVPEHDVALELLRLRDEVERLRGRSTTVAIDELAQGDDTVELAYRLTQEGTPGSGKLETLTLTWNAIFSALAASLLEGASLGELAFALDQEVVARRGRRGRTTGQIECHVDDAAVRAVAVQLRALNLMERSERTTGGGRETCFVLTPKGEGLMVELSAIRRPPATVQADPRELALSPEPATIAAEPSPHSSVPGQPHPTGGRASSGSPAAGDEIAVDVAPPVSPNAALDEDFGLDDLILDEPAPISQDGAPPELDAPALAPRPDIASAPVLATHAQQDGVWPVVDPAVGPDRHLPAIDRSRQPTHSGAAAPDSILGFEPPATVTRIDHPVEMPDRLPSTPSAAGAEAEAAEPSPPTDVPAASLTEPGAAPQGEPSVVASHAAPIPSAERPPQQATSEPPLRSGGRRSRWKRRRAQAESAAAGDPAATPAAEPAHDDAGPNERRPARFFDL